MGHPLNVITRVFVLVSLIMTSFNSHAAEVVITGDSQLPYTNTGMLTGTPTVGIFPLFIHMPIIGVYNTGSLNTIINATSGTINSSTGGIEFSFGVYSYGSNSFICSNSFGFSRIMGKMNNNKLVNNYIVRMYSTTIFKFNA